MWCADASAEQLEADCASDGAVATADKPEEAPVGPDSHAKQQVWHADVQEHPPSDIDSPDTATPSLRSDAEAADSSSAVTHAAPHTDDDGSEAATGPNEWVKGREDRPDMADEHASRQSGVLAIHCMTLALLQMHVFAGNDQAT